MEIDSFRHKCELELRRIVAAYCDRGMSPWSDTAPEGWLKYWWDHEMLEAKRHIQEFDDET